MNTSRRAFVNAAAMIAAGAGRAVALAPQAVTVVIAGRCRPDPTAAMPNFARLRSESAVFTRAYTTCPEVERGFSAMVTGRYPHAPAASGATLTAALQAGGMRCEVVDLTRGDDRQVDNALGRFVRETGADNRLLIFTATRGADRDNWYEDAVRVPLLFHWPIRIRPSEIDLLAAGVDIAPTVLTLCGVSMPEEAQGRDLSAFLRGQPGDRPEYIYGEGGFGTGQEWRMLVRGLDKAIFDRNGALIHLYNLGEDPAESTDLAGSSALERKRDELSAVAEDVRRRTEDHMDPSGLHRR